MSMIEWNERYNVGIPTLDNQHMGLVRLLNELYDAMNKNTTNVAVGKIIGELLDYTLIHFHTEEQLLKHHNYPDFESHKQEHENLATKAKSYHEQYKSGDHNIAYDLMEFLSDWIINHILDTDKKYSSYLKARGE